MKKLAIPAIIAVAALVTACGGNGSNGPEKFTVAVLGDFPYGTSPTDTSQVAAAPAFIQAINSDPDVSLVLHGGDIHSGKEYCNQAYNTTVFSLISAIKVPLVYVPGDNEWADCHKAKQGGGAYNLATGAIDYVTVNGQLASYAGGDPIENLAMVRSIFFPVPGKTLGGAMAVHTQAQEYDPAFPTDSQFVENTWWVKNKVLFATVNVPGGSNNGTDPWYGSSAKSPAQIQEIATRTGATLRWLNTAFSRATSEGATSVVLLVQADMWDLDGNVAAHIAEYKQYIDVIATKTAAFGKPVLLFNGDSHAYRSDNPLVKGAPCVYEPSSGAAAVACTFDSFDNQPNGYNVANFHRVTFHGSTTPLEYLKLTVDPSANAANGATAFGPFSWQRTPK